MKKNNIHVSLLKRKCIDNLMAKIIYPAVNLTICLLTRSPTATMA